MKFRVYDNNGEDITDKRIWYLDSNGNLYYMTNGANSNLSLAGDEYYYRFNVEYGDANCAGCVHFVADCYDCVRLYCDNYSRCKERE